MQSQSHTIENYLKGNYLLSNSTGNQLVIVEYPSQYYQMLYNFLNFQVFNHLNSNRPLIIISYDEEFHPQHLQLSTLFSGLKVLDTGKQNVLRYANEICVVPSLQAALTILSSAPQLQYEVLIRGLEAACDDAAIITFLKEAAQAPARNQVTVLLPQEYHKKTKQQLYKLESCRVNVEELIELEKRLTVGSQDYRVYDIRVSMLMKKHNGHSFLKQYLVDGQQLQKKRLQINKFKDEQPKKEKPNDMNQKTGTSFNLNLKQNEKQAKERLDSQINPYKQIRSVDKAPLLYQEEGDEKRIIIDDEAEDEDLEEVEEYEG